MYNTSMGIIKTYFGLILVIILSIIVVIPILQPGFFSMHDDTQIGRVYEIGKALGDGMFPVRWVSDLGYGYGYPIFNFYSPFPYYIGGVLILLGFDALLATKLVFAFGILLSGATMYFFAKNFLGKTAGVVTSVFYMYFPYHAVNIYVRGALGELFAYAFIPVVFWGLYEISYSFRENTKFFNILKWIILSSVGIALVIISHNLSAYMLFMFISLFIIFTLFFTRKKIKLISYYFIAIFFGFIFSAFYSIPAIFEMQYTNVYSQVGGAADFRDHFICVGQLWDSVWGFGGSVKGCIDGMSFKLGKINILILCLSLILFIFLLYKKRIKNSLFIYSSFFFLLFSVFMLTEYSLFIWKLAPAISFLQYPWRFLNFSGFFLAVICGILILEIKYIFNRKIAVFFAAILLFLTIFYNAKLFKPQFLYALDSSYYTNPLYLRWNVSKISDEYMPRGFIKPKNANNVLREKIEIVKGNGSVEVLNVKTNLIFAKATLRQDSTLKFNIANFPSWKIYVNEKLYDYKRQNDGLYLELDRGEKNIKAIFEQTLIQKTGNAITIIGILMLIIGIIYTSKKQTA